MADGNRLLSQNEIDELMAGNAIQKNPAVKKIEPSAPEAEVVHVHKVKPGIPPDALNGLTNRIESLEAMSGKISASEKNMAEIVGAIKELRQNVQELARHLQDIRNRSEMDRHQAQASPTYDLHNTFVCGSCQTPGMITTAVRCSQCGWEGWWGWYPQE